MFRRDFLKGAVAAGVASEHIGVRLFAAEDSNNQSSDLERRFPHRGKVTQIEDLNHNIKRIRFQPTTDDFAFTAGQFIRMLAPADYLAEFVEAGANYFILAPIMPPDKRRAHLQRLAEEVMPLLDKVEPGRVI